jgi:hypothetical protein
MGVVFLVPFEPRLRLEENHTNLKLGLTICNFLIIVNQCRKCLIGSCTCSLIETKECQVLWVATRYIKGTLIEYEFENHWFHE